MKQYIKIRKDEIYTSKDSAVLNTKTMQWEQAKPDLYPCNLWEWIEHKILKRHFTFGQPYCVVCGYSIKKIVVK